MAANYMIDWDKVNSAVYEALDILNKSNNPRNKARITAFLNWYDQAQGSTDSIYSPTITTWIQVGIPRMLEIIQALNNEITKFDRRLQDVYVSGAPLATITQASKLPKMDLLQTRRAINDFLGCQGKLGDWYVSILSLLAARYPQIPVFRNTIGKFQDVCYRVRLDLQKS